MKWCSRAGWVRSWLLGMTVGGALMAGGGASAWGAKLPPWMQGPVVLNDDGGWCWFQDERAIVVEDMLFVGSVAMGSIDPVRRGDVDVVGYDLRNRRVTRFPLHKKLQADDHDSPALLELPDGRLLAVYGKHGADNRILTRTSRLKADATVWEPERTCLPSPTSRVTYSNLHWQKREGSARFGRIYDFFRGLDDTFKPSWMYSDDGAASWKVGGVLIDIPGTVRHRPYVKFASDGRDTIHFAFTEGHPRDFDNGIHHAYVKDGILRRSDGSRIGLMANGAITPEVATRVFPGSSNRVAWIQDLALDRNGVLRAAWSVQMDSAGLPDKQGGMDHRYWWGRCEDGQWISREIAFAGSRLYPGEDDYTGGICLHPDDPDVVFISTNVDPGTGTALPGGVHELFRGRRGKGGEWRWDALTPGATESQLRPNVPKWKRGRTALLWLQGTYRAYTDYDLRVMCWIDPGAR